LSSPLREDTKHSLCLHRTAAKSELVSVLTSLEAHWTILEAELMEAPALAPIPAPQQYCVVGA
jgi:hypothetical protein